MNIHLLLISELKEGSGGRETWVVNFLEGMLSKDQSVKFNIYYIFGSAETVVDFLSKKYGDRVILNPIRSNSILEKFNKTFAFCLGLFSLKNSIKKSEEDLFLGVGGLFEAVAGLIAFGNIKKVIWLRTIYSREIANRFSRAIIIIVSLFENFIYKNYIDHFIANGEDTRDYYKNICENIELIPNSIKVSDWTEFRNYESVIRIAYVGRLTEVKGIKDFLKSIKIFSTYNEFNKFRFTVIGAGEHVSEVKKLANAGLLVYKGVAKNKELINLYSDIDVGVNLTYGASDFGGAGISHSLLEQLASGLIIVAWNNDIYRNIISADNGVLVGERDVNGLISAYLQIKSKLDYFSHYIENNTMLAKKYDIDAHITLFMHFLNTLNLKK